MNEPYPKNVITLLAQQFKLSAPDISSLTSVLLVDEIKEAIEHGLIEPAKLICFNEDSSRITILSSLEVQNVVALYQAFRGNEIVASKHIKISDLIFWLNFKGESQFYAPIPNIAELLLKSPEKIRALQEFIQRNAPAMKIWLDIRKEILTLNNLPHGRLDERRRQAAALNTQLISAPVVSAFISIIPNEILGQEYQAVIQYLSQHLNASMEQLESRSKQFIIDMLARNNKKITNPDTDITFTSKPSGKQLGKIMHVKYLDLEDHQTKSIRYFIKTHQGGSSQSSGSIQAVDPKELFIYKVLEYIGYGPKAHFYTNPLSVAGFYIATHDAAFTKHPDQKTKFFKTYENLKTEIALTAPNGFDTETKKGMIGIDMISRIFSLTDVATNPTNFGRVTISDRKHKWKIIDFDLRTLSFTDEKIFDGFKTGNGTYNYTESVGKIIRETPLEEKIACATQIINELEHGRSSESKPRRKMPFREAISAAFLFIVRYIKEHHLEMRINLDAALGELKNVAESEIIGKLRTLAPEKRGDFGNYFLSVEQNFIMLARGILEYRPDPALAAQASILTPPK